MDRPIVIVGAGITGLATAYFLVESGFSAVTVLERDSVGSGSTGHSAGMLICEPETASWHTILRTYGETGAQVFWQAQQKAMELVETIIYNANIDCDLEIKDVLVLATSQAKDALLKDYHARTSMDIPAELLTKSRLWDVMAVHDYVAAERTGRGLSIDPRAFVKGFAAYVVSRGVTLHEHTTVTGSTNTEILTNKGSFAYDHAFWCVGTFARHSKLQNYLTTIALTEPLTAKQVRGLGGFAHYMFTDLEIRSYHYGKLLPNQRLMVGYGDVEQEGGIPKNFVHAPHLRNVTRYIHGLLGRVTIDTAWSYQFALSKDILPHIERTDRQTSINGAGTQLSSIAAAEYAIYKYLHKPHPIDSLI